MRQGDWLIGDTSSNFIYQHVGNPPSHCDQTNPWSKEPSHWNSGLLQVSLCKCGKPLKKDDGKRFWALSRRRFWEKFNRPFMAIRSSTVMQAYTASKHGGTNVKSRPVVLILQDDAGKLREKKQETRHKHSKSCAVPTLHGDIGRGEQMDYLGLDDFSADMPIGGFAGAGGTRIEFAATTGRFERKKSWPLASEFIGEVPKQSRRNLARVSETKWLLWG